MPKPNYIEFDSPKGFKLPEGIQAGDEFELVCTFQMKTDGRLCLTELGDMELGEPEETKRPDYSEMTQKMQSSWSPQSNET